MLGESSRSGVSAPEPQNEKLDSPVRPPRIGLDCGIEPASGLEALTAESEE